MIRYTLEEAAAELDRLTQRSEKTNGRFTAAQVLHAGTDGRLLISVGLDLRCYSPSAFRRGSSFEEASQSEAFGWFVVPPRHLLALESTNEVTLKMVTSMDGEDVFFPFASVRISALRVMRHHLEAFAASLDAKSQQADKQAGSTRAPNGQKKKLNADQESEIRRRLAKGESQASLSREFGVSRPIIKKLMPAETPELSTVWRPQKAGRSGK